MKNSKLRKVLLLACSAVLLVCLSVGATLAYLTDKDTVVNTFTVGSVTISLDEYKTDLYGVADTTANRVDTNEYKLIPGHEYTKDPTIHVTAGSEKCILFVKVTNGISEIEADTNTIAKQMDALNWKSVAGAEGVYYYTSVVDASSSQQNVPVFNNFTISGTADVASYVTIKDETTGEITGGKTIEVIAYAVQADGFNADKDNVVTADEAAAAWTATFGASTTSGEDAEKEENA